MRCDIVTVFHCEKNYREHLELTSAIARFEAKGGWRMIGVDNRENNRGFAAGCNYGAFSSKADSPVIGFINPDCVVVGPFMDQVYEALRQQKTVICGNRFGKLERETALWGVNNWVCGAALFVRRDWFQSVGGFDERFVWSHEETDLIKQAEQAGMIVRELELPIEHDSPEENTQRDAKYKNYWFNKGALLLQEKWRTR